VSPLGVAPCPPPALEGAIVLADGRRLGFAEYGDPTGPLVLWFHGTPGARRQVPLIGRRAAAKLGLRLVCLERPGVGDSTDHTYAQMRDWAPDVAAVADRLGHERFMVVGLSGGGPYALACAHELPSRVVAAGLLGPVVPTTGEEEVAHGLLGNALRFNAVLPVLRAPLGAALTNLVKVATPIAHPVFTAFGKILPEGDRRVLGQPEIESMFIDDLVHGTSHQCRAFMNDIILFGRPWGFRLSDVAVPVYWWHGDADPFVGIEDARRAAALLPDVEFVVRPGESHLGEFGTADQVLAVLADVWHATTPTLHAILAERAPEPPESGPAAIP
jgi:pimeloyl-ACP methyl ester carboxylesterase